MINDHINDAAMRIWADKIYNDWAADFAKRSDPKRVFPLAISLAVLGFNLFGDTLRDAWDPKLRRQG